MVQYFPVVTGSLIVTGSVNISGAITASGGISISGSIASASYADTASFVTTAQTASFVTTAQTASYVLNAVSSSLAATASSADNLLVRNTLTAQTLVVQTITSSVDFVTGSTRFGSINDNTHQFTGSVSISGSSTTALNVNNGGLFISSSNNIGIGTSNPLGKTHIKIGNTSATPNSAGNALVIEDVENGISILSSTAGAGYLIFGDSGNNLAGQIIYDHSADAMRLFTSGSERVRITNTGSVGIGTTPNASYRLDVAGFSRFSNTIRTTPNNVTGYFADIAYNGTSYNFGSGETSDNVVFSINGGNFTTNGAFIWQTQQSGGTATERMRVTSAGRVGIGTSNPLQTFAVRSGISGSLTAQESTVKFINTGSLYCKLTLSDNANYDGVISMENNATRANNKLRIYIGNATTELNDHITLLGDGKVGIGTSSPSYRLDVNGVTQIRDTLLLTKSVGTNYSQTSTSGGTSIVNTGIYYNTSIIGFGGNAVYQVTVTGNPNGGGSASYRSVVVGYISVATGYDFGIPGVIQQIFYTEVVNKNAANVGAFTVSAVFWNGSSESSQQNDGSTSSQIRIKVAGYNSSYTGQDQQVRLIKITD